MGKCEFEILLMKLMKEKPQWTIIYIEAGKSQFCCLNESKKLPPTPFHMFQINSRYASNPKNIAAVPDMHRQNQIFIDNYLFL